MQIEHRSPWLIAEMGQQMNVLSWAPHRPGLVEARRVVWREVRNADLTPELNVKRWLEGELEGACLTDAVTMLTSRDIRKHHVASHCVDKVTVDCLATVGLGNAERVGQRVGAEVCGVGTINILAVVSQGLSEAALVEAITIASEARSVAIVEARHTLPTGVATGTGTDCIAIAAPKGDVPHAGKHTKLGEALGRAVYDAVSRGSTQWMAENG